MMLGSLVFKTNLVVGVYIGFDNPKSLGRFETGSKAALPVLRNLYKTLCLKMILVILVFLIAF